MKNTQPATVDQSVSEQVPWYTLSVNDIARLFNVESTAGVMDSEHRKNVHGLNTIDEEAPDSLIKIIIRQCKSPLLYILLFAVAIAIGIGEYVDAIIVAGVVVVNIIFGTIQEGRAQDAFLSLKKIVFVQSVVIRNYVQQAIVSTELVPGDIVLLRAGDRVAADMRILATQGMHINEASITGESLPVAKQHDPLPKGVLALSDQKNMLWAGTYVVSGSCTALVVATGVHTELGKLSLGVRILDTEMPLQESIRRMARTLSIGVGIAIAVLFLIGIILGTPVHTMIRVAVSLMVSVIPEGLPVIVTLVLAVGVKHMSKHNVLVKRLHAVEALGQARIIAVDKTGTLTRNELVVSEVMTESGHFSVAGIGYEKEGDIYNDHTEKVDARTTATLAQMGQYAALSANASFVLREDKTTYVVGDPIEAALRIFGIKCGYDQDSARAEHPHIQDVPFDFKKKYYISLFDIEKVPTLIQTGAAEVLIEMATYIYTDTGVQLYTPALKEKYLTYIHTASDKGLRVIGLSYAPAEKGIESLTDPKEIIFVGLLAMQDALRPEVPQALLDTQLAGMRVVMITGDHVRTAVALARGAGIYTDGDLVMSGDVIEQMSVSDLSRIIEKVSVFARTTPEHKVKIIQAYQERGIIVAMTGDGINDVPSLVVAHLGVAMGKGGTESAKDAADLVLLDDNFGHIPEAVAEGRHLYHAIKKVLIYLFSTNISEFIIIIFAVVLLLPLPLTPAQIIWLNVVTDTFLVVALALEPKEYLQLRTRLVDVKKLINRHDLWRIGIMATTMALGTLVIFSFYLRSGHVVATSMALLTLTCFQWFNIWNVRSEDSVFITIKNLFKNRLLVWSSLAVLLLQFAVFYIPGMQRIFNTTALSLWDWCIALAIGFSIVVVEELRKKFFTIVADTTLKKL